MTSKSEVIKHIKSLESLIKTEPNNFANYFHLGDAYRKINKYNLALKNYKKSVDLNKSFPEGFNNLASIYKELENIENSIFFFKKAIELNPNYINALYNLGNIYFDESHYEESISYFEKVLQINPDHIASLNNLGIVFKKIKKYDDALKCFRKIIKIDFNFLKAYNNIGNILLEAGDVENAAANYKKVLDLNPDNIISYKNLFAAYENSNQIKNYEKILKLAEVKFPNNKFLKLYKGILFFRKKKFKDSIKYLNKINFIDESETEIKRLFFLGKAYDSIKEIDKAFKFFTLGNQLTSSSYNMKNFNKKKYLDSILERKKYFIKENVNNWTKLNYPLDSFNPIFLIGFPRSGTTLLDTILRSHPKIKVIEEKPMILNMINNIKNNKLKSLQNITSEEILNLRKSYLFEIKKNVSFTNKSNIIIDKLPLNIINVGEIIRIFPTAKFILSIRHPLDCVLSCFMQDFKLNNAMSNFLNIDDASNLYKNTMNLWNQYISVLEVNYVSVKYEDLVNNFKPSVEKVLNYIDLKWDKSLTNYRETALDRGRISTPSYYQVIQPIYKNASYRWKKYNKYLSHIELNLADLIKKFEYYN